MSKVPSHGALGGHSAFAVSPTREEGHPETQASGGGSRPSPRRGISSAVQHP